MSALKLALVRTDKDLAPTVTKALSDCVKQEISSEDLAQFSTVLNGDQLEALGVLVTTSNAVPQELCQAVQSLVQGHYVRFVQLTLSYFDTVEKASEKDGNEQYAEYEAERAVWQKILRDDMGGENDAYSLSLGQFLQELALANKTPEALSSAVRCLTIHGSKGVEFQHVYLVGMAEDQLPSFQSKKAGDNSREMQEERRNYFVATAKIGRASCRERV